MQNYYHYLNQSLDDVYNLASKHWDRERQIQADGYYFDNLMLLSDSDFSLIFGQHTCEQHRDTVTGECLVHLALAKREKERSEHGIRN